MGTIPIRYFGDKAIITADKQALLEVFYENMIKKHQIPN